MENNSNLKVFLADDDPFCQTIYQQYLLTLGYPDISVFSDGLSCFEKLDEKPNVIFLDGSISVSAGFDMLRGIKLCAPDCYVVFLTGCDTQEDISVILAAGAFEYIVKGRNDLEQIRDTLNRIIKLRNQLSRLIPEHVRKLIADL